LFLQPAAMSKRVRTIKPTPSLSPLSLENLSDEFWMSFALAEAQQAKSVDEVPIGAVIVLNNTIIGRGFNQPIRLCDPTAHAEILALREAALRIENYRLTEATIYVTIEPCAMCAGAIVNARIKRIVYGAVEPRQGAVNSIFQICTNRSLNHQVEVTAGITEEECKALMQTFFQVRRINLKISAERCESG
jgi:tRNA(adenine34) deaminase